MSTKDRIASVFSLLWFVVTFAAAFPNIRGDEMMLVFIPLIIYWGYRFIKNDISFIGKKAE